MVSFMASMPSSSPIKHSNTMMKYLIIFLLCLPTFCSAGQFTVRDSQTGAAIKAEIVVQTIKQHELTAEQWLHIKLGRALPAESPIIKQQRLQANNYFFSIVPKPHLQVLTVSANGYQPLQTYISANSHIPITQIMLDKQNQDKQSASLCDQAKICGYLYDQTNAQALADVVVTISHDDFQAQSHTDQDGAFVFTEALPKNVTLTVQHSGYQSQRWTDIDTHAPVHLVIDLQPGQGLHEKRLQHPLTGMQTDPVDPAWLNAKYNHEASYNYLSNGRERSSGAVFFEPPASIRVGFNGSGGTCCGANCATSQVYSLETYVQRGLDDEWISFWHPDSLKAGSIPFRSYGAWHVMNQVYSGYDICAGPCCQAFEFTGYASTMNAAIATNGIMLENGELARSEYSAQNNSWDDPNDGLNCSNADLSCGDGSVGSPATGWPCLSDPLATGLGCFGHGRGMSQWGTQFRAQDGESFADIVDHYYNASNNPTGQRNQYASTPIRLDFSTTDESVISANDSFTIDFEVFNASDNSHPFGPVLLGASLYDGNNYYSDPDNDVSLSISTSGASSVQRPFQVDAGIPPGVYDLITALYLDVNQDSQITATDWLLQVQTQPAALEVLDANDLIFRDSF